MPIEVLIIDNNCTDETPQVIDRAARNSPFPIQRIVEKQQGLCYGRNRGLREARYDHVVYLDDDVEVASEWLLGYVEAVDNLDADCVVGPVNPKYEQEAPSFLTRRVLDSINSPYSCKGDHIHVLPRSTSHELPGCNFGVRKSVADSLGGFDVRLDRIGTGLLAGGDTDFGHRLVAAGYRTVYHPRCAIEHVILPEKLTKKYLRRRWYGSGATGHLTRQRSLSPLAWMRCMMGAGRLGLSSISHRCRGRSSQAFEAELRMLNAVGYLLGPIGFEKTARHDQ